MSLLYLKSFNGSPKVFRIKTNSTTPHRKLILSRPPSTLQSYISHLHTTILDPGSWSVGGLLWGQGLPPQVGCPVGIPASTWLPTRQSLLAWIIPTHLWRLTWPSPEILSLHFSIRYILCRLQMHPRITTSRQSSYHNLITCLSVFSIRL